LPFSLTFFKMWCLLFEVCRIGNAVTKTQYNFHESFDVSRLIVLVFVTNVESPIMSPLCTVHGGNGK
jgi:hypothetical protein